MKAGNGFGQLFSLVNWIWKYKENFTTWKNKWWEWCFTLIKETSSLASSSAGYLSVQFGSAKYKYNLVMLVDLHFPNWTLHFFPFFTGNKVTMQRWYWAKAVSFIFFCRLNFPFFLLKMVMRWIGQSIKWHCQQLSLARGLVIYLFALHWCELVLPIHHPFHSNIFLNTYLYKSSWSMYPASCPGSCCCLLTPS